MMVNINLSEEKSLRAYRYSCCASHLDRSGQYGHDDDDRTTFSISIA